jgi:hypothetical protein
MEAWVDEYEAIGKNMDALARQFADTHDPEIRKQIEDLSHQRVRISLIILTMYIGMNANKN